MRLIDYISWIVPWSAPVTTAYIVWDASIRLLGFPWYVALFAAVSLEGLGLTTVTVALVLWNYNQSKRKIDPAAPTWLAASLIAIYFIVAITLTVILKIRPDLSVYALAFFPMLSILGMVAIALIYDHRRRIDAVKHAKEERKMLRVMRQDAPKIVQGKYTCEQCKEKLASPQKLAAHVRWQHGNTQ